MAQSIRLDSFLTGTEYHDGTVRVGRKAPEMGFGHIATEVGDTVDVAAAFLHAVAYRFVFNEARVEEGKAHHHQRCTGFHGAVNLTQRED
jgi:hypothetical protein